MGLSTQDERALTESHYWRPQVGENVTVVFTAWRLELLAFKGNRSNQPQEEEKRPTLVMDVNEINGTKQDPPKVFTSSNKNLNKLLIAAIRNAERQNSVFIKVNLSRVDRQQYNVVDLRLVAQAVKRPVEDVGTYPF